MQIYVNGDLREVTPNSSVTDLLTSLGVRPDHVAVEINLQIVERAEFRRHLLSPGDRVEVLSFIGGGQWTTCLIGTD